MTAAHVIALTILFLLACALVAIAAAERAPYMDDDGCPEAPYLPPPLLKHKAMKDRLAMGARRLHAREIHEFDQGGPRHG